MRRTARILIVVAIVIGLGTVAFAVAAASEHPGTQSIPTVVTDRPTSAAPVIPPIATSVSASQSQVTTPSATSTSSLGQGGTTATNPGTKSPSHSSKSAKPNAQKSSAGSESGGREVVTPFVRDENDEGHGGDSEGGHSSNSYGIVTVHSAAVYRHGGGRHRSGHGGGERHGRGSN